ncbi:MAG: hypothetical protein ACYSTL_07485, partial [Planctomycetota bacterium]
LQAHSFTEARYYLTVTACGACGKGPWAIASTEQSSQEIPIVSVQGRCEQCGSEETFRFICENDAPGCISEIDQINPTKDPSRIIDVGQWLSLFYMLIESAGCDDDKIAARRKGFQAALCLAEALKFYGDNELPDESAFFSERSLTAFREHPEKFARQKLQDMRVKLPTLSMMHRHIQRDRKIARKRWWRFWK